MLDDSAFCPLRHSASIFFFQIPKHAMIENTKHTNIHKQSPPCRCQSPSLPATAGSSLEQESSQSSLTCSLVERSWRHAKRYVFAPICCPLFFACLFEPSTFNLIPFMVSMMCNTPISTQHPKSTKKQMNSTESNVVIKTSLRTLADIAS